MSDVDQEEVNGDEQVLENTDRDGTQEGGEGTVEGDGTQREGADGENPDGENPEGENLENQEPPVPQIDPELVETEKKIKGGLSNVSKIHDNSTFAYVNLNVAEKEIKKLYEILNQYQHLRYINISQNEIEDIETITNIPYLLTLNATNNQIKSLDFFTDANKLTFLQFLNLSNNQITKIPALQLPRLRKLILNENLITTCEDFQGHPSLEVLELRKNKLKNCKGIGEMLSLQELDLSENEITNFQNLENLPSLKSLILRGNKLEKLRLPLPKLPNIHNFDVSENLIGTWKEVMKLRYFLSVRSVNFASNPVSDEVGDVRKEILMNFLHYTNINEEEVTQEEREDTIAELEEKRKQEEEERKRKEEEEEEERRLKAEADEEERLRLEEEEKERLAAEAEAEANKVDNGKEGEEGAEGAEEKGGENAEEANKGGEQAEEEEEEEDDAE